MRVKRRIDEIAEGEGKSGDSRYWIPNVEQAISSRPPFAPVKNLVDRGYAGIKPWKTVGFARGRSIFRYPDIGWCREECFFFELTSSRLGCTRSHLYGIYYSFSIFYPNRRRPTFSNGDFSLSFSLCASRQFPNIVSSSKQFCATCFLYLGNLHFEMVWQIIFVDLDIYIYIYVALDSCLQSLLLR